jgi:hypothetical protein
MRFRYKNLLLVFLFVFLWLSSRHQTLPKLHQKVILGLKFLFVW